MALDFSRSFGKIGDAKVSKRANYIRPGRYITRIDRCKIFQNRSRQELWGVEMTVVHVIDNDNGKGHRVHEEVDKVCRQDSDYYEAELKQFICGVAGIDEKEASNEELLEVMGMAFDDETNPQNIQRSEQILAGRFVEVVGRNVVTQNNTDFTVVTFQRPVPAEEVRKVAPAEVADKYLGPAQAAA